MRANPKSVRASAAILELLGEAKARAERGEAAPPRRHWCSRCSLEQDRMHRAGTLPADFETREARPGGSLCEPCASAEFHDALVRKRASAQTDEERARVDAADKREYRRRVQVAEAKRLAGVGATLPRVPAKDWYETDGGE